MFFLFLIKVKIFVKNYDIINKKKKGVKNEL